MRGSVEIHTIGEDGPSLLFKEDNLIVDGAGEFIADVLTTSPSLSGISSASAILDVSNYTIQAITFGAPSAAWRNNLHSTQYSQIVSALAANSLVVLQEGSNTYYTPVTSAVPKAPSPIDQKLEYNCTPTGTWSGINVSLPFTTSAGTVIEDEGHHIHAVAASAQFGASAPLAVLYGCYAPTATAYAYIISSVNQLNLTATPIVPSASVASATINGAGGYVGRRVVDRRGFIGTTGINVAAGGSLATNCEIVVTSTIDAVDVQVLNLYGGIYHIGLWTIDMNRSLSAGNKPPYTFTVLNNPMRYRLFCKKTFTKNLCGQTTGLGSHSSITITWRLKFL